MSQLPPDVSKALNEDEEELCDQGEEVQCIYPAGECPVHDDVDDPRNMEP